ncbi:hypothetical protein DFH29DRAFT_1070110, partial [Suillus ampliporus]
MISVFNGAAHATITGYLIVSYFKEAVPRPHASAHLQPHFCLSTLILIFASNKAARDFLSDDIKQQPAPCTIQPNPTTFSLATSRPISPPTCIFSIKYNCDRSLRRFANRMLYTPHPITNIANSEAETLLHRFRRNLVTPDDDLSKAPQTTSKKERLSPRRLGSSQQSQLILVDNHQTASKNPDLALPTSSASPVDELTQTTAHSLGSTATVCHPAAETSGHEAHRQSTTALQAE